MLGCVRNVRQRARARYAKQLTEDLEFRHEWAEKVGVGFVLPESFGIGTGP